MNLQRSIPNSIAQACVVAALSVAIPCPLSAVEPDRAHPFETDAVGPASTDAPVAEPWRTVALDAEYSGQWVVVGDLDADGEVEIVSAQNHNENDVHYTSAVVVQNLDGSVLWRWGDPKLGRRELHHDVACQIHDFDNNGSNEVILAADRELVVLDGKTGTAIRQFPIPAGSSDCVVFADLSGKGWASEILVKSRYRQIWAYSPEGALLWTVDTPGGYRTSHQPFPVDLDGDGRDEILAGYAALNPDGSVRWVFQAEQGKKNGGHADCWRVVRMAEKADDIRLVMTMCGGNALVLTDGNGQVIWRRTGQHYESVDVGEVRPDCAGLEIVVDVDHLAKPPKPLCLIDERGEELGRINTDYTRHHKLVDFDNDGLMEIGSALPRGLFDGRGRRVLTFGIGADEQPWQIATVDLTGHGMRDVLLITDGDRAGKVYLYKNPTSAATPKAAPLGTGMNFTLY